MALLAQLIDDVVAHRFELTEDALSIGRHPSNSLQIDEEAISGRHAVIETKRNSHFRDFKEYFLEDLNSTNGTYVNGKKVIVPVRLHHNDIIRMAWTQFKFIDEQEAEFEKTVHMIGEV